MACDTEKKELDKASKALNEASEDWWQGAVAMGVGAVVVVGTVLTTPFTLGGSLVVGGTLIATFLVLVTLVWANYELLKVGVWLDYALPLLGIQAHSLIAELEERYVSYKSKRDARAKH